jgi:FtsH-binding integral membrane protein
MSNAVRRPEDRKDDVSQGPSLKLVYSLIALALAAAIGFALLIVLPFYNRR